MGVCHYNPPYRHVDASASCKLVVQAPLMGVCHYNSPYRHVDDSASCRLPVQAPFMDVLSIDMSTPRLPVG